MDIRNVTEFRNFVNANQLNGLSKEIQAVTICITDYERGCSCWKEGDRQKIYDNCKALYIRAVGIITSQFSSQFVEKTPDKRVNFFQDGVPIGAVGR